jgi:SAM-dependent methyltransferase/quercetin dioxygenase-like cupin family protein
MIKQAKIWGTTSKLFSMNNCEVHRIEIKKGGYCSKHIHNFKYNMFFVESGVLEVKVLQQDSNYVDSTVLYSGDQTVVAPGKLHIFEAREDTVAYEIYWVAMEGEDINRQSVGGVRTQHDTIYTGRYFRRRIKRFHKQQMMYAEIFDNLLKPKKVLDVGCGIGSYLLKFKKLGCDVVGSDKFFDRAKPYCDNGIVENLYNHDACVPFNLKEKFDLTLCIDVANTIPPIFSQDLVRNLVEVSSEYIIFAASTPGNEGPEHINCRDKNYWKTLFSSFGFMRDRKTEEKVIQSINNIKDPLNITKNMILFKNLKKG